MEIDQKSGWFTRQRLVVLEDKVVVHVTTLTTANEFSLPLAGIQPDAVRTRRVAIPWFATAAGLLLASGLVCWMGWSSHRLDDRSMGYFFSGVFALIAIIVGYQGFRRTFDVVLFRISTGNLVLYNNRPDPQTFRTFLREFQERLTASKDEQKNTRKSLLDWLKAQALLDEWSYKEAVNRLELESGSDGRSDKS